MKIRAVLLDAGHTLLHAHPSVGQIYAEVAQDLGADASVEDITREFGPAFRDYAKEYSSRLESNDEQDLAMWRHITSTVYRRVPSLQSISFEEWFGILHRRFGEGDTWRLYDDVIPVLEELRRLGYRLGIVSNWDTRLRKIVEAFGVSELVDTVVISAEVGVRKPHPRIFDRALSKLGVEAEEAVHVGDSVEDDVEGALRSGVRPFLIHRENLPRAPKPVPNVPLIRSLRDLLNSLPASV